jgi:hypothetical protein
MNTTTDNTHDERQRRLENWSEHFEGIDPHEIDSSDKRDPDSVPPSEYCHDNDGGYNAAAGVTDRGAALQAGRCGAVLTNWPERYGEKRYCTRLPVASFVEGGSQYCYEHREQR